MVDDSMQRFRTEVWDHYRAHGRHELPWRQPGPDGRFDAYPITVSELMLQQTQVGRVIPKYDMFIVRFPTVHELANAQLGDVLRAWSGLGYNRRAKFLWQTARAVENNHAGIFPGTREELVSLPGIGPNTAGAILAYAYNQPAVFVETNIRTAFIHHFFHDSAAGITDAAIMELAARALDKEHPREWYWALMDYGSYIKRTVGNLNRRSTAYSRQSPFHGSRRQVRGEVLRLLGEGSQTARSLSTHIQDERLPEVLETLVAERLVKRTAGRYRL